MWMNDSSPNQNFKEEGERLGEGGGFYDSTLGRERERDVFIFIFSFNCNECIVI